MPGVNWLAVVAAAIVMFGLGALWYSPVLFLRAWQTSAGVTDEKIKASNIPMIFGVAFVLTLLMAANLAFFIAGLPLGTAIGYSVAAGLGWAAFSLGIIGLFERRPLPYFLVNGGYLTVGFALMGLVLGLWR